MWDRIAAYIRQHHLALLCLFLIIGGGTAWALERNSVRSRHIVNGQVRGVDVKESSLRGVLRGSGRVVAERTFMTNGTTTVREVLDLRGFGRITGNCPNGATPGFTFTNETSQNIEVIEADVSLGDDYEVVAPDATATLAGDAESPRLIIWRFAIGDAIATVWPFSQKPSSGSDCHIWMHALITK